MVTLNDVTFAYKKTPVFDGIDLSVKSGFLYGILGRNGTGKSTLLNLMSGMLEPSHGRVEVLGNVPFKRSPSFLQRIFMIPEEFFMPDISIDNFVKHYGQFYPLFNCTSFNENLDAFEIPRNTLQRMSYGQKKKVLISFGLATGVSLLLMDEPTNGLDVISKSQFRKVMARSIAPDKSIMISSHQVSDLSSMVDHLIVLDSTKITVQSSIQEIEMKLVFKVSDDPAEAEGAIYAEASRGGTALVALNEGLHESMIDLELFYKAAMYNPQGIAYALSD